MAGINPINGPTPPIFSPNTSGANGQTQGASGTGFDKVMKDYIGQMNEQQQTSAAAIQDLLTGKTQGITSVVAAVAKADMSFKLLIGVRNKIIEAYKQTMNMQV